MKLKINFKFDLIGLTTNRGNPHEMETLFQLPALRGAVALRLYASGKLCNDFPSTGTRYNTFLLL